MIIKSLELLMDIDSSDLFHCKQYNCDVVLLDGLWGTGKTMFQNVISSLSELEDAKIEEFFEFIINLEYINKIDKRTASYLIENYIDLTMHKSLLGRNINMRINDDTGFKNSTNKIERLKRLFRSEEENCNQYRINNKGLTIMTHMIGCSPFFIANALKERLFIIEIMRHPLYMLEHVSSYFARFHMPREKTMSFKYNDKKIPWFYKDFIDLIDINQNNPHHKAVEYIYFLYLKTWDNLETLKKDSLNVYSIGMEQFALETNHYLDEICNFLSRSKGPYTNRALKKSKLPRKYIHAGLGLKKYGFVKSNLNNKDYYMKTANRIFPEIDIKYQKMLKEIIKLYDENYPSILTDYFNSIV